RSRKQEEARMRHFGARSATDSSPQFSLRLKRADIARSADRARSASLVCRRAFRCVRVSNCGRTRQESHRACRTTVALEWAQERSHSSEFTCGAERAVRGDRVAEIESKRSKAQTSVASVESRSSVAVV